MRPAPIPDELAESFQPVVGTAVMLRPLRPEDIDIETAFVRALSPESRHNRLLGGTIAITPNYLERLTRVDYSRDMAFAATVMLESELLIGVARYVRDAEHAAAEFALVVADAWHGRGIGTRLLQKLVDTARQRGLRELYGDVLSTNRPMLGMVQRLGFKLSRSHDDPSLVRATLPL